MNGDYLYEAMGGISPVFVDEAEKLRFPKSPWRSALSAAACVLVLLAMFSGFSALLTGETVLPLVPTPQDPAAASPVTPDPQEAVRFSDQLRGLLLFSPWAGLSTFILGLCLIVLLILTMFRPSRRLLQALSRFSLGSTAFFISFSVHCLLFLPAAGYTCVFDQPEKRILYLLSATFWLFLILSLLMAKRIPGEKRSWGLCLGQAASALVCWPVFLWLFPYEQTTTYLCTYYGLSLAVTTLIVARKNGRTIRIAGFCILVKPILRLLLTFAATWIVHVFLYIPGMQLLAALGSRLSVGGTAGSMMGFVTYAGAVPLLILYWKKTPKADRSWGIPLGIAASIPVWNRMFARTADYLRMINSVPYELDDARFIFWEFYIFLMTAISAVMVGKGKWDHRKQRKSEQAADRQDRPRWYSHTKPFWAALVLEFAALLPVLLDPLLPLDSDLLELLYLPMVLLVGIILLSVYLTRTEKANLSFGVPLAVLLSAPMVFGLLQIPSLLGIQESVYSLQQEELARRFFPFFYLPMLLISAISVGWLRFLHWRKDHTLRLPNLTGRQAFLLHLLAAAAISAFSVFLALQGPDIHLEKGEFLMLESDAPMLFAVAFGLVTLAFALFLMTLYRKQKDRPGLWCFVVQWALTLLAFHFLMQGLTLRPGDVGGMYTETVSLHVGLAGISWAASILSMGMGLKRMFAAKKGDEPYESE